MLIISKSKDSPHPQFSTPGIAGKNSSFWYLGLLMVHSWKVPIISHKQIQLFIDNIHEPWLVEILSLLVFLCVTCIMRNCFPSIPLEKILQIQSRLAWLLTSYFFLTCPGGERSTVLSSAAEKVELKPNKVKGKISEKRIWCSRYCQLSAFYFFLLLFKLKYSCLTMLC